MDALLRDIRIGTRSLLKRPAFVVIAVVTLALGLGANTAIFSFVNALLLRPLPFPAAERLVVLSEINPEKRRNLPTASPRNIEDWQKQSQTLEQLGAWRDWHFRVSTSNGPLAASSAISSPEFFQVLGIKPLRGRLPLPEENQVGRDHVVVITNSFWQTQFAGAENAVGQTLFLDKEPFTIVGILPANFEALNLGSFEIWAPLSVDPDQTLGRHAKNRRVYARVKESASLEAVQSEMTAIASRLAQEYPAENGGWTIKVNSLQREEVGDLRRSMLLFLGAVGIVLLIACINVSNLLLARVMARRKEFAVRIALGAGRFQLVRQLLTESVLLSLVGGAAGLLLAIWLMHLFIGISPTALSHAEDIKIDATVLGFTFLLAVICGILFGVIPGIQSSSVNLVSELKDAPGLFRSGRALRLWNVLVISQVALAVTLLIGAGLLGQTFLRLLKHDPGFNTENLVAASVFPPVDKYKTRVQVVSLYDQIAAEVKAMPGVQSVGFVSSGPQFGGFESTDVLPEGEAPAAAGDYPQAVYFNTSQNYFATMGIPLLRGRDFSASNNPSAPQVAIINQTMAQRFWPNQDAVGKRLTLVRQKSVVEIIGVVGDIERYGLGENVQPEIYFPYSQQARWATFFVVRTNMAAGNFREALQSRLAKIDSEVRLSRTSSMDDLITSSLKQPRFNLVLVGIFAATALLLAAVGIYGVMSYLVEQQTREIGIRSALGAKRSHILKLVIGHGVGVAFIGIVLGLVAAFGLTRFLAGLLYGVTAVDPLTFLAISILLLMVAVLACYIPGRRATKVDPLVALRYE
ncbi:MAG TPA: ABC transporter permease [Pyrinomonadaceae bacterium]|nr:ABC transporter permease [Pyrinomonadaceae bacterium]